MCVVRSGECQAKETEVIAAQGCRAGRVLDGLSALPSRAKCKWGALGLNYSF